MHSSDFIPHSQQTARTEGTNLRGRIKEQGLRLKREKEEGNRERAELSRMRQEFEKSQQLTRELEEMLEVQSFHFSILLECTPRLVICYPDITNMVQYKPLQHSNPLKTP